MKTIKMSRASRTLAEYAAELTDEVVVVTDRNRPVAAIVPLRGVDRESVLLSGHPEFLKIIARSRAQFRQGHTIPLAEMKAAFAAPRSKHLQPTKAQRAKGTKRASRARLRS